MLKHQIPGGMMSNLEGQLKEMNAFDRMNEIFEEVHRVQADLGYPPLATPFAQMVGSQATFNVIFGERYKTIPKEVQDYIKGLYGTPPGEISKELTERVLGDQPRSTVRPGSLIPPGWEALKEELMPKGFVRYEEDVLTCAMFPQLGKAFLKKRKLRELNGKSGGCYETGRSKEN